MKTHAHRVKEIESLYMQAFESAIELVELEARNILRKNKSLDEFVMAMGSASFTTKKKKGTPYYDIVDLGKNPSFKRLNDFINQWDSYLKITGEAMRFTANGPKITDW